MSDRSVWDRLLPRNRYAGAIGFCLVLVLNLSPGQGMGQGSHVDTGTARPLCQDESPLPLERFV